MLLFDDIARPDRDVHDKRETAFTYLNRSGRPEGTRIRQMIESWLAHYPTRDQDSLIARLRSSIDDQHLSAFFELFVHELLLTCGHRILEIEPELPHTVKSPDFLVQTKEGQRLYLECVLATGRSQHEVAAQARLNQALSALNRISSPRHFLSLSVDGMPDAPMSVRAMTDKAKRWIAGLPDDHSAMEAAPFQHQEHGVTISLSAAPRQQPKRASRANGVQYFLPRQVAVDNDIRSALDKKARRYGVLDQPYVVAVNALGMYASVESLLDALLGSSFTVVQETAEGFIDRDCRDGNGVWRGSRGFRRKGLSAVLSTEGVTPWNFALKSGRLIRHPYATGPLGPFVLGIDDLKPDEGHCHFTAGQPFGKTFGLPDGWPQA